MLDPTTHKPSNSFQLYDGTGHKPHDTWEATNSALWPSKPGFEEPDDSGICSPPMWTTSPPHRKNHYRSLSPTSRTQAIVRGQRELMEMVKNMPESNYELSLKDLVEHHRVDARQDNTVVVVEEEDERNLSVYRKERGGGSRRIDKMAQVKVKRNGSIDRGGFYLKMVFPFSLGSKDKKKKKNKKNKKNKNKKMNLRGIVVQKLLPKPDGSAKGVDKEWWKKSPSACRDSDSGASSINSGSAKSSGSSSSSSNSSRRSTSRREKRGNRRCWPFISRPKSLTQK